MASYNNRLRYLIPFHQRGEGILLRSKQDPYRIKRKGRRFNWFGVKAVTGRTTYTIPRSDEWKHE